MELLGEIHKTGHTIIFVTHNPELTRFATRVVYMQDGAIRHDEQTKLGEVGRYARSVMYAVPETTEEDDLQGVSMLMHTLGKQREAAKSKQKKPVKPAKAKKAPAKRKRAAK